MRFGYTRTSTTEQHLDRGLAELQKYFDEHEYAGDTRILCDQQTGKNFDRPNYRVMRSMARAGDEIVVTELDRLGRNKAGTLAELKYYKEIGVIVRILEIPTTLIDFNSMENNLARMMMETINNMLIEMYATLAHAEMEKKEKRQREGIEQMKLRGDWDKYGRPQVVSERRFKEEYQRVESGEITAVECIRHLGVGKTTFYNLRKKYIVNADNK